MLITLVMDFLAFKPEFSRRLSRIFFSASSRLSRNFRDRLAGLAQIAAAGRLSRRLRGLPSVFMFSYPDGLPRWTDFHTTPAYTYNLCSSVEHSHFIWAAKDQTT